LGQTGIIYRACPQSFQDSNGDGDLRGIIRRPPYFDELFSAKPLPIWRAHSGWKFAALSSFELRSKSSARNLAKNCGVSAKASIHGKTS
jgi:hypothetical protein